MGLEQFIKGGALARLVGLKARETRTFDDFDGAGGRFKGVAWSMWALTGDELARAGAAAMRYAVETCKWSEESLLTGDGRGVLLMATKAHHLAAALRCADKVEEPLAESGTEVLRLLEPDEIEAFYERFLDWQQERSPFASARDWKEVEGFVEALGKGWTEPTALSRYDSASLRSMLLFTARALHRPTTPRSSDTSPASESSDSSTTPTP